MLVILFVGLFFNQPFLREHSYVHWVQNSISQRHHTHSLHSRRFFVGLLPPPLPARMELDKRERASFFFHRKSLLLSSANSPPPTLPLTTLLSLSPDGKKNARTNPALVTKIELDDASSKATRSFACRFSKFHSHELCRWWLHGVTHEKEETKQTQGSGHDR